MLLGNSNLWLNLREIQINSVLLIGQLELFINQLDDVTSINSSFQQDSATAFSPKLPMPLFSWT
jgi:hypothetical protein